MGEWISTVNGLISLITALVGLIGTGIGAFFAIKNWIKATKEKSSKEIWAMIMEIADAAMREAEQSDLHGKDKKGAVLNVVKAGCKAAGIDIGPFIDQLGEYIDQCIEWYNGMSKVAKN